MNNLTAFFVLSVLLSACGAQEVTPVAHPNVYIDHSCSFQQSTWILNATDGVPVARSEASVQFVCITLENCSDAASSATTATSREVLVATNCFETQGQFEAAVSAYAQEVVSR